MNRHEAIWLIQQYETSMHAKEAAVAKGEYEEAARLRDRMEDLKRRMLPYVTVDWLKLLKEAVALWPEDAGA